MRNRLLLGFATGLGLSAAVWALRRLAPERADELRLAYLARESDSSVMDEWSGDIA